MSVKRVKRNKRKNTRRITIKKHNKRAKSYNMQGGADAPVPAPFIITTNPPYIVNPGNGVGGVNNSSANQNRLNVQNAGGSGSRRRRGNKSNKSNKRRGSKSSKRRGNKRGSKRRGNKRTGYPLKQSGGSAWLDQLYAYAPPPGMMGPVPQPSQSADANNLIVNAANISVAGQANAQYDRNVCPV
jgi:hypothetical protein